MGTRGAQVLTAAETDTGRSLLADCYPFWTPGRPLSLPGEGALSRTPAARFGGSRFWALTRVPAPQGRPRRRPRGPAHSGRGSEPHRAGVGVGAAAAPLRSRAAVTRARSPGERSGSWTSGAAHRLRRASRGRALAGASPRAWPEDQALGTRPRAVGARTIVAPGRGTGDAVCSVRGGGRGRLAPWFRAPA